VPTILVSSSRAAILAKVSPYLEITYATPVLTRGGPALAYALVVVVGVAGCGVPPELAQSSPSPAARRGSLPDLGVTPTVATPIGAASSAVATPARPTNKMPVVRSVRVVPDKVDPLGCTPPDPPERPEVTAVVEDSDTPLRTLVVELSWTATTEGASYEGEARMGYDSRQKAFVYRLPSVTRQAVGERPRTISLTVHVRNGWDAADWPTRETIGTAYIGIAGYCLNPTSG
jgi:hypothetical protein